MRAKVHEKRLVISLRKKGCTYNEIMKQVPNVSKGSLSLWCRNIEFTPEQIEKLKKRIQQGRDLSRIHAAIANRNNRLARDKKVYDSALKEFSAYKNDVFFSLGIALYWAEGSKTRRYFQFTNSDAVMTKTMVIWIEKYLKVDRKSIKPRLYIHRSYEHEGLRKFWANQIGVSENSFQKEVYKQDKYGFKKNENYKGCIRIDVPGVTNWVKTMAWQKILVESLKI